MKVKMKYKKSTKTTHVYEEITDTLSVIPTLYIKISAFSQNLPREIEVEVTYA